MDLQLRSWNQHLGHGTGLCRPRELLGGRNIYAEGVTATSIYGRGAPFATLNTYGTGIEPGTAVVTNVMPRTSGASPAPHVFQRNAAGLTYGSGMDASATQSGPDLILPEGENQIVGYVRSTDLSFGLGGLTGPQLVALETTPHVIPLFAQDGTTVLGKYDVPLGTAVATTR